MRRGMTGAKTYLRCLRTPPECETAARGTERTPLGPAAATSPTDPPQARVRPRAVRDKRSARVLSGERELEQRAFGLPYPVPRSEVGVGGRRTGSRSLPSDGTATDIRRSPDPPADDAAPG